MEQEYDDPFYAPKECDLPAFPVPDIIDHDGNQVSSSAKGLSKREYYAGLAMQGMLSDINVQYSLQDDPRYDGNNFDEVVAKNSVEFADALIKELSKPQPAQ